MTHGGSVVLENQVLSRCIYELCLFFLAVPFLVALLNRSFYLRHQYVGFGLYLWQHT